MELSKMYAIARERHGDIGNDVVHDLFLKFGGDSPPDSYTRTCIKNARPQPLQKSFDIFEMDSTEGDIFDEDLYDKVCSAVNTVREKYELEVDTFLECKVNGDLKSFSSKYGISRSVLERICNFAQHEILKEYERTINT